MFVEAVKLIGILLLVIVAYVLSGIVASTLVKHEDFDFHRLTQGVMKALTACVSLIVLAYVASSDLIDLSSIGFEPKTFISSGILLYGAKLLGNISELIGIGGITKKITGEEGNVECATEEENTEEPEETDCEVCVGPGEIPNTQNDNAGQVEDGYGCNDAVD